jgi:hypothetical protein
MIDVEALIREQFSKLDPLPATLSGDWGNVLARVQGAPQIRSSRAGRKPIRPAVVAAAVAVLAITGVVTPLGAAIGRSFGDFSAWISGSPGTPASPGDQQAFEQENERSWNGFPAGTQLRQLLQTEAAGMTFKLFGFRSGDSLCLRLVVSDGGGTRLSCAPVSALQQAKEPALVLRADDGVGSIGEPPPNGYTPVLASFSFGIVSDGVSAVTLSADDGVHQALIGGNAFLQVSDHPPLGTRTRSVKATAADGSTVALPFSRAPFGENDNALDAPTGRPVTGPKGIERHVNGGRIAWLERQEKRGEPIPLKPGQHSDVYVGPFATVVFAREIQPDPANPAKMILAIAKDTGTATLPPPGYVPTPGQKKICFGYSALGSRTSSCSPLSGFFVTSPISYGTLIENGGDQFAELEGVVSDDVQALELYLTDGTIQKVELRDNAFAISVGRALLPARIVARDEQGATIGNQVIQNP